MTDELVKRLRRWPPHAPKAVVWPADLLREAADRIEALERENEQKREALQAMVDEWVDYMTINHLGDPWQKHNMKLARAALEGK